MKTKSQKAVMPAQQALRAYKVRTGMTALLTSLLRCVFLFSFSYVLLYPFLFMVSHALENPLDYLDPTVQWVPKSYTLENFKLAVEAMELPGSLLSTLLVQVVSGLIEGLSCAIAAYGLARFEFRGKRILKILLLLNILVPVTMILIPTYLNFRYTDFLGILGLIGNATGRELRINLLNTPLVFYLPSLFAVGLRGGLFIYIYMQFFKSFPRELEEAAWIDGTGGWGTFFRVVIPSSGVVFMTVFIFSIIWHWNEYYGPSMYLSDGHPLAVKVHDMFNILYGLGYNQYSAEAVNATMAVCLLFVLPMLIMYLILQRRFIESVARSGIVG